MLETTNKRFSEKGAAVAHSLVPARQPRAAICGPSGSYFLPSSLHIKAERTTLVVYLLHCTVPLNNSLVMSTVERPALQPLMLLDGGMGTTLEDQYGVVFSPDTPLWSSHLLITSPSTLKQVHSAFVNAGAEIVLTATYQLSFDGFSKTQFNSVPIPRVDAEHYMLSAVSIARSSFGQTHGIVALSLGAYGAVMIPSTEYSGRYGSTTESDLISFHQDRLMLFVDHVEVWREVNLVAFETLPRLDEIRAVRRVASLIPRSQHRPYWISVVFSGNDDRLPDGASIPQIITALLSAEYDNRPFAIGINCTKIHKLRHLIIQFERAILHAGLLFPILVLYPDGAGRQQVYNTELQKWTEADHASDASVQSWDEHMATIVNEVQNRHLWKSMMVGGCCKTTPSHIAKLRQRLKGEPL